MNPRCRLRALVPADTDRVSAFVSRFWRSDRIVAHGEIFRPAELPGFGVFDAENLVGVISYNIAGASCEVVALATDQRGDGVGTALLARVVDLARSSGLRRVWLITTNDNVDALRFYQRRGFSFAALRPRAIEESRKLKPEISAVGAYGIPIRDELELEMILDGGNS